MYGHMIMIILKTSILLNYYEYYSFGEDHIYITDKVELKDLEDALKDTSATYFKVRS